MQNLEDVFIELTETVFAGEAPAVNVEEGEKTPEDEMEENGIKESEIHERKIHRLSES